jgi:hypothetical protein
VDLLVLIDQLEEMVRNARPIPLTDQVRLEKKPLNELIEQIRAAAADASAGGSAGNT